MAPHIVFVESNYVGISGIRLAVSRGYRVSFIHSPRNHSLYSKHPEFETLRAEVTFVEVEDSCDEEQLFTAISKLHEERPVSAVVSFLEYSVLAATRAALRLGVPSSNPAAVGLCRNKGELRRHLASAGLERVTCFELSTETELEGLGLEFPCVVKPAMGTASLGVSVVRNKGELRKAVRRCLEAKCELQNKSFARTTSDSVLVEEYLNGRMLSFEIGVFEGQASVYAVGERLRARSDEVLKVGTLMPAELNAEQLYEAESYLKKVLHSVGFDRGFVHIETVLTSKGLRLIEINPRLMGGGLPNLYNALYVSNIYGFVLDSHLANPAPHKPPQTHRAAASRLLGAASAGQVRETLDWSWKEKFSSAGLSLTLHLSPSQKLSAAKGNNDYFGHFFVFGADVREANRNACLVEEELERMTGIELLKAR